jgi:hypothetical protein
MSRRETKKFRMYDQNMPDFDVFNSVDSELIEISGPPIKVYRFNIQASLNGKRSGIDELYNESDIIDEEAVKKAYQDGFGGTFDPSVVREGEIFDPYITLHGYYVEPTWTNELTRLGVENVEDELAITFNYDDMISRYGREIRIGDVLITFRQKLYRCDSAFIADEVPGWKYIHYRVIGRKPRDISRLILPN